MIRFDGRVCKRKIHVSADVIALTTISAETPNVAKRDSRKHKRGPWSLRVFSKYLAQVSSGLSRRPFSPSGGGRGGRPASE